MAGKMNQGRMIQHTPLTNSKSGRTSGPRLRSEVERTGALNLTGDLAVHPCGEASEASREDLARFGGELGKILGLFEVNFVYADVITAARHALVGLSEVDETLRGFRFHERCLVEA